MENFNFGSLNVSLWLLRPLIYFLSVFALLTIKRIAFRIIRRVASQTKTHVDDIFLKALDLPILILSFGAGFFIVGQLTPFAAGTPFNAYIPQILKAAIILALIIFLDKFSGLLIQEYTEKIVILKAAGPGVVQTIVRVIVITLGLLILMDSFGLSISPILASLGIGSLAVALAIQPTLENIFAGVQVAVDKPFAVGHLVRLESGEEGYVYKMTWRSTWIRLLPNNMIIIPNKLLVNSRITNYHYPSPDLGLSVKFGVHYNSDLNQVERVALEAARETLRECSGAVSSAVPSFRLTDFGDSSIDCSVSLRARDFETVGLLRHDFIKRLQTRFVQEGIVIPYPVRAINYEQEKVPAQIAKTI